VRATVFDAVAHDLNVMVLSDGTASEDMDIQDANILDMINIGVKVLSCEDLIKFIDLISKV
jgi:nicotinamidase-related amidase